MKRASPEDTAPFQAPPIPEYKLIRCIGLGSYGKVWLGQSVIGGFRAIKVIDRQNFPIQRPFEREFRGIEKFEPVSRTHPGLVSILHIGRNEGAGYFYYVMELADDISSGQKIDPSTYAPHTLNSDLARHGKLPIQECFSVARTLSSALGHLHKHGLVHRDIKPSNIIFINGVAKFADIGLVSEIGERATFVGTEGYVAPEGPGRPTADLYGLGKVLYQVSTGHILEDFPKAGQLSAGTEGTLEEEFHEIILQMCDLNPRRRFQSGDEIAGRLAEILEASREPQTAAKPTLALPKKAMTQVVLLYQKNLAPDARLARFLGDELARLNCQVFAETPRVMGLEEAGLIEEKITNADFIIPLLSEGSVQSEMLAYEIEIGGQAAARAAGKPRFIPVRLQLDAPLPPSLQANLALAPALAWRGPEDNQRLIEELRSGLQGSSTAAGELTPPDLPKLEAIGGAVPLDSHFYLERPADLEFREALARADSIILIKGARQMGKTSLLARGLQYARNRGPKVVLTDFQQLNNANLESLEALYRALGQALADQLDLDTLPEDVWDTRRSPNTNFERYLTRDVLARTPNGLVWGLDEVDRLFTSTFGTEVFGLFRSWHNKRALDPDGPWARLVLAIAYATEAHLFITDLVQSPFNVGTRVNLEDFTEEQISELNDRYGHPLKEPGHLHRFRDLFGGQPFLVRRALNQLASQRVNMSALEAMADRDEGPFGDHLRRLLVSLSKDRSLAAVLTSMLKGNGCPTEESFYRLRSAGVVVGESPSTARLRCQLYEKFLRRHFNAPLTGV